MVGHEHSEQRLKLRHALQELTHGTGVQRKDLLEALAGGLSELQRHWSVNLANGEAVARATVVANLRAHIDRLTPRRSTQPIPPMQRRRQYLHAVFVCFNLLDIPELVNKDLTERRKWLGREARGTLKIDDSTCRRDLRDALNQIEQQILDSGYEPPVVTPDRTSSFDNVPGGISKLSGGTTPTLTTLPPQSITSYVLRSSLDERFNHLWNTELPDPHWRRRNTLCLVGEPGTGKSRYLRELVAMTDAVWINADTADALSWSLADALERYEVPVPSLETLALKRSFSKLLARPDGPSLVVIDGIADPKEVDVLIPQPTPNTRLIITSRKRPPEDWPPVLRVGDMTPSEATAMISSLLPDTDPSVAHALAEGLGCRPLAIEQACAFIQRTPDFDALDLVNLLRRDPAVTLQALPPESEATLMVLYKEVMGALRTTHPDSYRLLLMLAFMPPLYVPPKFFGASIAAHLNADATDRKWSELRVRTLTEPLRQLCLLEEDALGIRLAWLTQAIIRVLLSTDDVIAAMEDYHAAANGSFFDLLTIGWTPREVASLEVIDQLFFRQVDELVAIKGSHDQTDDALPRREVMLTADQWSALTEALWERSLRVSLVAVILRGQNNESVEDIQQRFSADIGAIEKIAASIPDRDAWVERFKVSDPEQFLHWLETSETINREARLALLSEDREKGFQILATLYFFHQALTAHMSDPIVETRLGRFDLREIYPQDDNEDTGR